MGQALDGKASDDAASGFVPAAAFRSLILLCVDLVCDAAVASLAFTASYWHIAVLTGCRPAVRQFVDHALALALALVQLADLTAEARHGVHVR